MRATLNLDDQLFIAAKHWALEQKIPVSQVIENALRKSLSASKTERKPIRLVTASGLGLKHGVDLDSGSSLLDIMDNLS